MPRENAERVWLLYRFSPLGYLTAAAVSIGTAVFLREEVSAIAARSAHLDLVGGDAEVAQLHDRVLGELLGVVAVGLAVEDQAGLARHQAEGADPPVQAGLDVGLEGVHVTGERASGAFDS